MGEHHLIINTAREVVEYCTTCHVLVLARPSSRKKRSARFATRNRNRNRNRNWDRDRYSVHGTGSPFMELGISYCTVLYPRLGLRVRTPTVQ